jgi:two-component system sensor histidine kinase DesK
MVGLVRLSSTIRELHATRQELVRLKVEEERLRLSRDLHDLLGHTLSMITLKSELAGRLVEQEPTQAVQEMREVERVARQALREVRQAVAGYRHPQLIHELESAREILSAAGIACQVEQTAGVLSPETSAMLAWTVREGVTNVIRHSQASFCHIRIVRGNRVICAEITNDGSEEPGQKPIRKETGSGLAGLSERVSTYGGQMKAGSLSIVGKEAFRLWVELPIQDESPVGKEPGS